MDRRVIGLALFVLLIAGCGGGGGGDGETTDGPRDIVIVANAKMDGWSDVNGHLANDDYIAVGDFDKVPGIPVGVRGFLSFDLSAIPAGATVESAVLQLYQSNVDGDPYSNHGVVVAFHADYGDALTSGDYTCAVLPSNVVIVSETGDLGRRQAIVSDHVRADRAAGRPRTQFRLEFNILDSDDDGTPDSVTFDDSELGGAINEPPRLFVTYRP